MPRVTWRRTLVLSLLALASSACGNDEGAVAPAGVEDASTDKPKSECVPGLTLESLAAATEALDRGETDVALDTNDCARYSRTVNGDLIEHEEIFIGGQANIIWDHTAATSTGQFAPDADGVFQNTIVIERGATETEFRATYDIKDPSRVKTVITGGGAMMNVESWDTSQPNAELIESYEAEYDQPAKVTVLTGSGSDSCNQDKVQMLKDSVNNGLGRGIPCLWNSGLKWQALALLHMSMAKTIVLVCKDLDGNDAQFSMLNFFNKIPFIADPVIVYVDAAAVNQSATGLSPSLMFHELMHAYLPPHNINMDWDYRKQTDQVYACQELCFGTQDRCVCAMCRRTNNCDPECAGFPECGVHRCTCQNEYYNSEAECLTGCRVTMGCYDEKYCQPIRPCP